MHEFVTWDDEIPNRKKKKIQMFQSPPTSPLSHYGKNALEKPEAPVWLEMPGNMNTGVKPTKSINILV